MSESENKIAAAVDVTPKKDGGLLKEVLREGSGESPFKGDTVYVHYTGTLLDGTKFDSSRDRGEKFSFKVGEGSVIKGWDLGVPTMKKGELSKFTIREDYGYGKNGSPPTIPPGATLVFEIELFDFEGDDVSENKDKSVMRRVIKEGSGYTTPNDMARCVVKLQGKDGEGRVFDEREVEFEIGEGARHNIVEGVEKALLKFKKEERSLLTIKSSKAWGAKGCEAFKIPPHTDVTYEVELKRFEKAKENWQLNGKEKLEQSEIMKNKGNELFKEGKYEFAMKKYEKIVDYLQNEVYDLDEEKAAADKLKVAANLNIGMCCLKSKEYRKAIEACGKVLEVEAKNEKALFRTGEAYFGLAEYEDAIKSYAQLVEINPENKDAVNKLALSKKQIKEHHDKEKKLYSKMLAGISK